MSPPAGIKDLRPLALGELIDRSAIFWRAHLVPLFVLCLGFQLVDYIFEKSVSLTLESTNGLFLPNKQLQARVEEDPAAISGDLTTALLALTLLLFVLTWTYWLSSLVVSRYVVPVQLGESARPTDGLRRALRRLGSFTGAYLLSLLWGLGIGLLLVLPGGILVAGGALLASTSPGSSAALAGLVLAVVGTILIGLGALAAFLWYFLRFSLLGPVFAMEDLSATDTFRRSGALISGRVAPGFLGRVKVRAMILLTAVSGIIVAVSLIFSLPAWIVRGAYGQLSNPSAASARPIPQALLVPVELFQVLGQSIFIPLTLVFSAMFYLDMRMRREGLDLERRLTHRSPAP